VFHRLRIAFIVNVLSVQLREAIGTSPVMIGMSNYLPIMYSPAFFTNYEDDGYCSFAYSALASFRMGMSGSASFQSVATPVND
jgi:hypothetical protein